MIIQDTIQTSSITDWISAIGVLLGVPITIVSLYKLFMKDKEQERKLNSLEKMAIEQNNIVLQLKSQADQMIIQSGHFQYQASLMKESNRLIEKQLELQTGIFLHDKDTAESKIKLEAQKRLSEIKPYFSFEGSSSGPDGFKLMLQNLGKRAENVTIKEVDTKFVNLQPKIENRSVDNNNLLNINGYPNANTHNPAIEEPYEIDLNFSDIDGNKYFQKIKKVRNGSYLIEDPQKKA
ncbi:hypothetical protein QO206_13965 [Leeuwenhoekiella aequorea]|uniref:hypothetical protein n=1 Tax=Leeuwenhoekiella aequorea TaxID=283736 RepID=UPI00352E9704|tara:strand:- start:22551 stop:23258 length:708 start_codon:yes stop_codon:yes gene_type:complete